MFEYYSLCSAFCNQLRRFHSVCLSGRPFYRYSYLAWLNCGRYLVLPSWQYLKSQIALCQAVYAERQNSNLSLYFTAHYSADSATVAPIVYKLCSYSHYFCALLTTVRCCTIYTISTTTHSCWICHYAVTVQQYVQCYHLANCTSISLWFLQLFITVRQSARVCWHRYIFYYYIIPVITSFFFISPLTVCQSWCVDWDWCAVKYYLMKPINTSTVITGIVGAYSSENC